MELGVAQGPAKRGRDDAKIAKAGAFIFETEHVANVECMLNEMDGLTRKLRENLLLLLPDRKTKPLSTLASVCRGNEVFNGQSVRGRRCESNG